MITISELETITVINLDFSMVKKNNFKGILSKIMSVEEQETRIRKIFKLSHEKGPSRSYNGQFTNIPRIS